MKTTIQSYVSGALLAALFCASSLNAWMNGLDECAVAVPLLADRNVDIGDVFVTNDGDALYITYVLHPEYVAAGWRLSQTRLALAGTLEGIPQTRKNQWGANPLVDNFPYGDFLDPVEGAYTHHVFLDDLGAGPGDFLYIAAHAELMQFDSEDFPLSQAGAWGEGARFNERGRWGMYFTYEVCEASVVDDMMVLVEGGTLATINLLNGTEVSSFYIDRHEMTFGEWQEVRAWAAENGYDIGAVGLGCDKDHPVHNVNWFDALKWSNAKSEMKGLTPVYTVSGAVFKTGQPTHTSILQNLSANGYRLPMEAEWEFAARGGNLSKRYTYAGSNDLEAVGWYWDNSAGPKCPLWSNTGAWPVGRKAANELGLYDMSGNVWELCWDQDEVLSTRRLIRGGSWISNAFPCRVTSRTSALPTFRDYLIGFRLARSSGS